MNTVDVVFRTDYREPGQIKDLIWAIFDNEESAIELVQKMNNCGGKHVIKNIDEYGLSKVTDEEYLHFNFAKKELFSSVKDCEINCERKVNNTYFWWEDENNG